MTTRLFIVIGPAGSGKSTVSTRLAASAPAAYLDKDTLATAFTGALLAQAGGDPSDRDGSAFYRDVVMQLEYDTLLAVAGDNLRLGNSVVLDAPFVRYFPEADYLERAAVQHGWPADVEVTVVHVVVEGALLRQRLVGRASPRDAWKLQHWDEFWASAQAARCLWRGAHHALIDNDDDDPAAIEQALAALL